MAEALMTNFSHLCALSWSSSDEDRVVLCPVAVKVDSVGYWFMLLDQQPKLWGPDVTPLC